MNPKYLIIYRANNHDQRYAGDHTSWSACFTGVFGIPRPQEFALYKSAVVPHSSDQESGYQLKCKTVKSARLINRITTIFAKL